MQCLGFLHGSKQAKGVTQCKTRCSTSGRKSRKEKRKKYLSRECVVSACVGASVRVRVSAGLDDVHALLELARIERLEFGARERCLEVHSTSKRLYLSPGEKRRGRVGLSEMTGPKWMV